MSHQPADSSSIRRRQAAETNEYGNEDESQQNLDKTEIAKPIATHGDGMPLHLAETCIPEEGDAQTDQDVSRAETVGYDSEMAAEAAKIKVQRIGNYEIRGILGRGGMGVVYRAWQESANRFVALKVIRQDRLLALPKSLQQNVIDRFQHEAQAAGRLEHDHIVTIYEVGEDDGQHFFSMRYVEGRSLYEMLHDGPLDGKQAARYMEPVARALYEAHQHGILHRDLKPQNILIDGKTRRALIADFGIAKLAEQAEQASAMTQIGEVIGTPAYMSPEQASDSSRVTARSDIYSLGATLYHTLVGAPPFTATSVVEIIRQVSDVEAKPLRDIDPNIDRDLATIVHKCIEKDPSQRYASAEALADDLALFLAGEPISARPVSQLERIARFSRKNPWLTGATVAAVAFLIIAVVVGFVGWRETSQALGVAETETQKAKDALIEADLQRDRAERTFLTLKDAVDKLFVELSENELFDRPGMQGLRKDLLERAATYYEKFLKDRGDDPDLKVDVALAHFRIGTVKELIDSKEAAVDEFASALKIQNELLAAEPNRPDFLAAIGDTLNALATLSHEKKDYVAAADYYSRAIQHREQAVELSPTNAEFQRKLANAKMNFGMLMLADPMGDGEEALQQMLTAQEIRSAIGDHTPKYWMVARDCGAGCFNLANYYRQQADIQQAIQQIEEAARQFDEAAKTAPENQGVQLQRAYCFRFYGDLLAERALANLASLPEAEQWFYFSNEARHVEHQYDQAAHQLADLVQLNPEVWEFRSMLAGTYMNAGYLMMDVVNIPRPDDEDRTLRNVPQYFEEAERYYGLAFEQLQILVAEQPSDVRYRRDLANLCLELAHLANDSQNPLHSQNTTSAWITEARSHFGQILELQPDNLDNRVAFLNAAEFETLCELRQAIEKISPFGG